MLKFIFFLLLPFLVFPKIALGASSENDAESITLSAGTYSEIIPENILTSWITTSKALSISKNDFSEFENTNYCPVNGIFCQLTITEIQRRHFVLTTKTVVDEQAVKSYTEDLARKINRDPVDAKFKMENGKVENFAEAQDGIILNTEKNVQEILDAVKNYAEKNGHQTVALTLEIKKPSINSVGDINDLGISALIGEGVSDFKGSPANRIYNIKVAIQRFNGILIKPGEEFSFVKILGEVDGEHGYKPELVIKKNKTEPEFGGGICQVSTTTFRAAIYSGLKITARRNHAYPVSYYNPQGMDSTVYVPSPDLRFKNNTPGYILIQTKIEGTKLFFDFYGTNDGRKTEIDGPTITEKQPDGAMKTTFTQHVFDKDGNEFIKDVFNSAYDSPYKYPHPGGPVLTTKPSNWSKDEWKEYQQKLKDLNKVAANGSGN